jgi:formylglycine-generating enzyme required for sulfatase activity
VDVRLRIEAGLVLGELGDPRYEERQGPHGRYLWPKQWVLVPGGVYRIGDDQSDQDDEKPETEVTLAPFEMAFAPVTNAEYRCFIEAGGYEDERWWQSETAQRWRREGIRNEQSIRDWTTWLAALREDFKAGVERYFPNATPSFIETDLKVYAAWSEEEALRNIEDSFGGKVYREPGYWNDARFNAASQPVVGLTVFEAQAYACWLAEQSGQRCRLPVEAEWEAAARGPDRHRWPWGNLDAAPRHLNADPTHLRRTSPIGVFPDGDSPTGLCDLAGNVWEWTCSAYTDRHELDALIHETEDPAARRVVRGGAWSSSIDLCRASFRYGYSPDGRYLSLGFRLVASGPIPDTEP